MLLAIAVGGGTLFSTAVAAAGGGWTEKHEAGRCAIRGTCGKQGFFGSELPCPDNGSAETPDAALRTKLVGICGDKWQDSDVCCTEGQVCVEGRSDYTFKKHGTDKTWYHLG